MTHLRSWLAYSLDGPVPPTEIERRLRAVEGHYRLASGRTSASEATPVRSGRTGTRLGTVIWDFGLSHCRWPAWTEDAEIGVASVYVPFSTEISGIDDPLDAALGLARRLRSDPSVCEDLKPPTLLAIHDGSGGELMIVNDAYGYARLYELRFPTGWVWSNRLGALFLFAAVAPEADPEAWCCLADIGWFMGRTTPMTRAILVEPGTVIRCHARSTPRRERTGILESWISPGSRNPVQDELAAALLGTVRSCSKLWPDPPLVDLTGGHDSRLIAAAFVASDLEARFLTVCPPEGEIEIADTLLAKVDRREDHQKMRFDLEAIEYDTDSLTTRLGQLMRTYDGHFAPETLLKPVQLELDHPRHAHMSGMAGELVRRTPLDRLRDQRDRSRRHELLVEDIHRRIGSPLGIRGTAKKVVTMQISAVLDEGRRLGLGFGSLLHHFYLMERIRRWSGANVGIERVAPLIDGPFLRAALSLGWEERITNRPVRKLTELLVPAWSEVPYFKASSNRRLPRADRQSDILWNELFRDALAHRALWEEVFDIHSVRALRWLDRARLDAPFDRQLLARLLWRVHFEVHLQQLRKRIRCAPQGAPLSLSWHRSQPRRATGWWRLARTAAARLWKTAFR